jgi:tRNA isopentenyl-2-thiomethyl-A-37 hydroxylase MiaE
MDLKHYYQKIRDIEAKISEEFPIIASRETPDGGKEGVKTEVPRRLAAKLIAEGLARLATKEEARVFLEALAEAKRLAEQAAAAARVQVAVLSSTELDRLRGVSQPKE